jgi:hypothetical protein
MEVPEGQEPEKETQSSKEAAERELEKAKYQAALKQAKQLLDSSREVFTLTKALSTGVLLTRWAEFYLSTVVEDDKVRDAMYDIVRIRDLYNADGSMKNFDERELSRDLSGTLIPFINKIANVNKDLAKQMRKETEQRKKEAEQAAQEGSEE